MIRKFELLHNKIYMLRARSFHLVKETLDDWVNGVGESWKGFYFSIGYVMI